MACIEVQEYRSELTALLKSKDLANCGFQKRFQTHPPKPTEAEPSFNLLPAKLGMFLSTHVWVR